MDSTKTGIWRDGLASLLRRNTPSNTARELPPAPAVASSRPLMSQPPSPAVASPLPSPPPPPPRTHVAALPVPSASELQATRVWPIERLLANLAPPPAAYVPPTPQPLQAPVPPLQQRAQTPAPPVQRPLSRRYVRLVAYVLIASLVRTALALMEPSQEPARVRRASLGLPAQNGAARPTRAKPPLPARDMEREPAQPAEIPALSEPSPLGPAQLAQLERSAVDALIAGDHVTARQRYAELARARPSQRAFGVAMQVLAAREREPVHP